MVQTVTPYLCVRGARTALDWYRNHFGASVSNVIEWEGRVGHAELEISGAVIYVSDEAPTLGVLAPRSIGAGSSASFVLQVADVDAFVERAVAGGAVLQRPIEASHGTRNGWLMDPFGHRWNVCTPLPDASSSRRAPSEPYYFTLSSPDVERAAAFYGAALDWEFTDPNPHGGRHVSNTRQPIGLRPLERVRAAGGQIVSITSYDSGREAVCLDDQGTTFRLSEPAPGYDPDG